MVDVLQRGVERDHRVQLFQRATPVDVPLHIGVAGFKLPDIPTPPETNPLPDHVSNFLNSQPFYVAHRLGGHDFPEHTMEGLQASLAAGYKAVEFSTYITRDGVFVGSHDWTTQRTTGVYHEIWDTDWEVLQQLDQAGGKMIRIEQMAAALPDDVVVFLDHKDTSARETPSNDGLRSERDLFDLLPELFEEPQKRIIWKVFAEASSAERARSRGYRVNCMLYPDTLPTADYSRWDVLGMEWNAAQEHWDTINATGLPTIGHIIYNQSQAQTALAKGAKGLMVSVPTTVYP